jgi:DNA invertase Pin-like site-specific DNA recombinase
MRIAYVRNQDVELMEEQLNRIVKHGIDEVVLDRTGERLPETLNRLRAGDSLHIARLDRLSREIRKATRILEDLYVRGVEIYVAGDRFQFEALTPEMKLGKAIRDGLIANYGERFLSLDPEFQREMIIDTLGDLVRDRKAEN